VEFELGCHLRIQWGEFELVRHHAILMLQLLLHAFLNDAYTFSDAMRVVGSRAPSFLNLS
jgi:hypothetical protein